MRQIQIIIILFLFCEVTIAQIETEIEIDTLKIIQSLAIQGDLIEYNYREFDEPIYLSKSDIITSFNKTSAELTKMDRFTEKDSTRIPYSSYLQLQRCIEYLQNQPSLIFTEYKTVGFPEDLPIHDLTDRYLGEIICDLLDLGKFKFSKKSDYKGVNVIKAIVYESTKYYGTESIKYYVGKEEICTCPPVTHYDFVAE